MIFPEDWLRFDGSGTRSGGCYVLVQVQADRWFVCDARNPGLCLAQVAPSTVIQECVQTAFVPKTHADAGLFLLLQAAELSRMAERNCGGAVGREGGIRPCAYKA